MITLMASRYSCSPHSVYVDVDGGSGVGVHAETDGCDVSDGSGCNMWGVTEADDSGDGPYGHHHRHRDERAKLWELWHFPYYG